MNRSRNVKNGKVKGKYIKDKYSKKGNRDKRDDVRDDYKGEEAKLNAEGRPNDPNWYFFDKAVADQVSQLSFRELADLPVEIPLPAFNGSVVTYPMTTLGLASIMAIMFNPAPGVQKDNTFATTDLQRSGINMAGFRLRSKLAAFTGRTTPYGPQDISTMILYEGEIISMMEWLRRAFGVCFTMNMYNRAFPQRILEAMSIDASDMFTNYSSYRTRFNALVTRLNQIPIPKSVAYFDKCASMYERIFMDSNSPMGQIIIYNPATTWFLDETSNPAGTELVTHDWCAAVYNDVPKAPQPLSVFLSTMEQMVDDLFNSSTFEVVYTDLLNLATKLKVDFWKFDYLLDGYVVMPEYNDTMLMMLHNATIMGAPRLSNFVSTSTTALTPANNVVPNAAGNALFYNPGFRQAANMVPLVPSSVIVDSKESMPNVEDRIEMLRFTSTTGNAVYNDTMITPVQHYEINTVLPDHYVVSMRIYKNGSTAINIDKSVIEPNSVTNARTITLLSQIDWAPFIYMMDRDASNNLLYSGDIAGDTNFYTTVDSSYLRKIIDFAGLALYDIR